MPAAKRRTALAQSLNALGGEGRLSLLEAAPQAAKTKDLAALLSALKAERALLVLEKADPALRRAGRNIAGLTLATAGELNAYDVLRSRRILMTEPALKQVAETLTHG
jgi:large subunit ribosomal protein L4